MRMSSFFIQTLRDAPGDARTPGHQLLVRAGFLRGLGSGAFAWLPLGDRSRRRLAGLAETALHAVGGQAFALPLVQPAEGATVPDGAAIRFRDRNHRTMILAPNKERTALAVAASVVQSYRQLPALLYQARQRYSDDASELNDPVAAREGAVVEAYSLHADSGDLDAAYSRVSAALTDVIGRAGLTCQMVIAEEDAAGRPSAHRWLFPWDGDQAYVRCVACGYAASQETARIAKPRPAAEPLLPMEDVATPDCKTIAELAAFLGIPEARTAKAVFLMAGFPEGADRFVFAVVRGDTALNEAKLKKALGALTLGFATEAEIRLAGAEPGYGSPVGLQNVMVVVDELAAVSPNLVAGANRPGYHTRNVNLGRDYRATLVADIALASEGSGCPVCGESLALAHGVELAAARRWDERLSRAAEAVFLDREGRGQLLLLGSYRLHLDRLLAAAAEQHRDAQGLRWPAAIAPFDVYLMTVGKNTPEVTDATEQLYRALVAADVAVLYDDRDERAGVKFNDADLLGIPLRLAVGERGLKAGMVEIKRRGAEAAETVGVGEVAGYVVAALGGQPQR